MKEQELDVNKFVKNLLVAEKVRESSFQQFMDVANENGYSFSEESALSVLKLMKENGEELPKWLEERIGHLQDGRPWPD